MYETSSITLNITYLNIALSNTYEETTVITGLIWFTCITIQNPTFNELKITNKTSLKLVLKTSTLKTTSCKTKYARGKTETAKQIRSIGIASSKSELGLFTKFAQRPRAFKRRLSRVLPFKYAWVYTYRMPHHSFTAFSVISRAILSLIFSVLLNQ